MSAIQQWADTRPLGKPTPETDRLREGVVHHVFHHRFSLRRAAAILCTQHGVLSRVIKDMADEGDLRAIEFRAINDKPRRAPGPFLEDEP